MFGILFGTAMTLGMVSVSGFSQSLFVVSTDTEIVNHMDMKGHITFTTTDQDGNILSYIQTDNIIVNVGENCVAEALFNVTTDSADESCDGTGTHTTKGTPDNGIADGGFTFVGIGTGATGAGEEDEKDTILATEVSRLKADPADTTVTVSSGDADSSAVVTVTVLFTADDTEPTINESGLFDSLGGGNNNMLARQTFDNIPLTEGDKLTVEWEITIGS